MSPEAVVHGRKGVDQLVAAQASRSSQRPSYESLTRFSRVEFRVSGSGPKP